MRVKTAFLATFTILLVSFLFVPRNIARAWFWDDITQSFSASNIRKTMVNATVSVATDVPSQALTGRNLDQVNNCLNKISGKELVVISPEADVSETDDCSDLKVATPITGKYGFPTQTRSAGSLTGLAIALEDVARNRPETLNLALYTKHMARKIPVVNQTAFAAEGEVDDILLGSILTVWEAIRNLSYGILGLFMVAIGIMVILRQKINPQTVVSVQYAIPRVIIAVILITFSYPIGALALSSIVPLSQLAFGLLKIGQTGAGGGALDLYSLPMASLNQLGILMMSGGIGEGLIIALLQIVLWIVFLYFVIRILLQILMSYVKIAVSVLVGPFIFSWGAIPGNEEATLNWFKSLAVNVLAIPAMAFVIGLARFMQVEMITRILAQGSAGSNAVLPAVGPTSSGIMGALFFMIVEIGILMQGVKVPAKLEEAVMGPKYGGKKK